MEEFKISEIPQTEIFVVKAEYQYLNDADKVEVLELAKEWINSQLSTTPPTTEPEG